MRSKLHVYFGGTFDPPHLGHEEMLRALLSDAWVERVHVVPTGRNPLKPAIDGIVGEKSVRLRFLKSWLGERPDARVSLETIEFDQEERGPQFTVDTLEGLQKKNPAAAWALCVGGDIPKDFHRWKNIETLFSKLHSVWVFPRGSREDALAEMSPALRGLCEFRVMSTNITEISSTEIRALLGSDDASRKITESPLLPSVKQDMLELARRKNST